MSESASEVPVVPDLGPLGLPGHEEALLGLVLRVGSLTTGDAAARLGVSGAQVSRAAAGLRDRGFLAAGLGRRWGIVLAPLDRALAALVEARRRRADDELSALDETAAALLAVARWRPDHPCPHTVVPRDLRELDRVEALRELRDTLDVVVDRHHVNCHVPPQLLRLPHLWFRPVVRLLVTGVDDDRPLVVLPNATDVDAARAGVQVRRLRERCAAFSVYDGRRVEVPLWRLEASGWSDEPGEVWAASRLFETLWSEAVPRVPDDPAPGPAHRPPWLWPVGVARGSDVIGSAP